MIYIVSTFDFINMLFFNTVFNLFWLKNYLNCYGKANILFSLKTFYTQKFISWLERQWMLYLKWWLLTARRILLIFLSSTFPIQMNMELIDHKMIPEYSAGPCVQKIPNQLKKLHQWLGRVDYWSVANWCRCRRSHTNCRETQIMVAILKELISSLKTSFNKFTSYGTSKPNCTISLKDNDQQLLFINTRWWPNEIPLLHDNENLRKKVALKKKKIWPR